VKIMNGLLGPDMPCVEVLSRNLLVRTWEGGHQKNSWWGFKARVN
jgi:hypothetical protein